MNTMMKRSGPDQDVHVRGKSGWIMGDSPFEKHASGSQRIDMRRLQVFLAVAADSIRSDRINAYQENIQILWVGV
jgi:hypothetical protein